MRGGIWNKVRRGELAIRLPAGFRGPGHGGEHARAAGIEVTLCGELAADPLAAPILPGLGLDEFSVGAPLIPELKRAIARCTVTCPPP